MFCLIWLFASLSQPYWRNCLAKLRWQLICRWHAIGVGIYQTFYAAPVGTNGFGLFSICLVLFLLVHICFYEQVLSCRRTSSAMQWLIPVNTCVLEARHSRQIFKTTGLKRHPAGHLTNLKPTRIMHGCSARLRNIRDEVTSILISTNLAPLTVYHNRLLFITGLWAVLCLCAGLRFWDPYPVLSLEVTLVTHKHAFKVSCSVQKLLLQLLRAPFTHVLSYLHPADWIF